MSLSSIDTQTTSFPSTTGPSAKKKASVSVEADFVRFVKMSPIDRMRAGILKSMDLTEERLAALSPAERRKVEDVIKKKIQEALTGKSGSGNDKTAGVAMTGVEATAAGASMSAGTLGGLIAIQAVPAGSTARVNA